MPDERRVLTLPMTAAYFRLILRRFGTTAARRAALLAGTGSRDAAASTAGDGEIAVRVQLRQLANLQRFAGPGWGLEMGAALDGATHGPAGAGIVTAASLGAALATLARYATVRTPFIDLQPHSGRQRYVLRVLEQCDLGTVRTPLLEMVLLSTQWVVESALGRRMVEATFSMPAPRPAHWRRYAEYFHAPVEFAGRDASVSLPADWLHLPCPLADPVAHRSARARLEAMRQRLMGDFVDVRIEALLAAGGDAGAVLGDIAAQLRLSPRTLVRRLQRRDTSYRRLLDGHRRRRAVELLLQPELSVAEIAERLGYGDATNFARACRRWFAMSPRAYRSRRAPLHSASP